MNDKSPVFRTIRRDGFTYILQDDVVKALRDLADGFDQNKPEEKIFTFAFRRAAKWFEDTVDQKID